MEGGGRAVDSSKEDSSQSAWDRMSNHADKHGASCRRT